MALKVTDGSDPKQTPEQNFILQNSKYFNISVYFFIWSFLNQMTLCDFCTLDCVISQWMDVFIYLFVIIGWFELYRVCVCLWGAEVFNICYNISWVYISLWMFTVFCYWNITTIKEMLLLLLCTFIVVGVFNTICVINIRTVYLL